MSCCSILMRGGFVWALEFLGARDFNTVKLCCSNYRVRSKIFDQPVGFVVRRNNILFNLTVKEFNMNKQ